MNSWSEGRDVVGRKMREIGAAISIAWIVSCGNTAVAQQSAESAVAGVNPKDNITKFEVLYKYDDLKSGASINSLTLKYDTALNKEWGVNFEAPIVYYRGFGRDDAGLGDAFGRHQ